MTNRRILTVEITGKADGVEEASHKAEASMGLLQGAVGGAVLQMGADLANFAEQGLKKLASFGFDAVGKFEDLAVSTRKVMRETGMGAEQASELIQLAQDAGVN